MINEINERIRNKEQFIENVERRQGLASSAAISVKNVCLEEVAFLKELLKYVDALIFEKNIERLEKKLEATEQVLADLIVKCESHACSGNKEGEKFFDPLEKQELIQKLTEIDDE